MRNFFLKIKEFIYKNKTLGRIKLLYNFKDYNGNITNVKIDEKIDISVLTEDIIGFIVDFVEESGLSVNNLYSYLDKFYDKKYNLKELKMKIKPFDKSIKSLVNDKDFISNIKLFIISNEPLLKDMVTAYLNHYCEEENSDS